MAFRASIRLAGAASAASAILCVGVCEAASLPIYAGGAYEVPVTSFREARFRKVIPQRYDFSCGSAAVATLLTYYYDRPTDEASVFKDMFHHGDQEKIRRQGFSLLDMKLYLERQGYEANGYRVSLEKLHAARLPAIVLINVRGYMHFVVIQGMTQDKVLMGDPASGTRAIARGDFLKMWNEVVFVILDHSDTAQRAYNDNELWRTQTTALLGTALMRDGLSAFTVLLRGPNEF